MGLRHRNRSTSITAMPENKKADVEEHPARAVFHVGLLINGPPGSAEMPFATLISHTSSGTCKSDFAPPNRTRLRQVGSDDWVLVVHFSA